LSIRENQKRLKREDTLITQTNDAKEMAQEYKKDRKDKSKKLNGVV